MGLFKFKPTTASPAATAPPGNVETDWPSDGIDDIDDASFADAIAAGRVTEPQVVVAA